MHSYKFPLLKTASQSISSQYKQELSSANEFVSCQSFYRQKKIGHMPKTFLDSHSPFKGRPRDPQGRIMDGWAFYAEVTSFHRSSFENARARSSGGGSAVAPLRLSEAPWGWGLAGWVFVWLPPAPPESHEPWAVTPPYGPPQWPVNRVCRGRWIDIETKKRTKALSSLVLFEIFLLEEGRAAAFNWILIKLPGERSQCRIIAEQVEGCFLFGLAHCAVLYTFLNPFLSNIMFLLMA